MMKLSSRLEIMKMYNCAKNANKMLQLIKNRQLCEKREQDATMGDKREQDATVDKNRQLREKREQDATINENRQLCEKRKQDATVDKNRQLREKREQDATIGEKREQDATVDKNRQLRENRVQDATIESTLPDATEHDKIDNSVQNHKNCLPDVANVYDFIDKGGNRTLKLVTLNICGVFSKLNFPELYDFVNMFEVICLVETKLDPYDSFQVEGYDTFTHSRKNTVRRE